MRRYCCYLATCLLVTPAFVGCQSKPLYSGRDALPIRDYDNSSRSLALDHDVLVSVQADAAPSDAWWIDRRDHGPVVYSGYVGTRHETSITYTHDTQYISGGRAHDRYRQTTHRRSVRESHR